MKEIIQRDNSTSLLRDPLEFWLNVNTTLIECDYKKLGKGKLRGREKLINCKSIMVHVL